MKRTTKKVGGGRKKKFYHLLVTRKKLYLSKMIIGIAIMISGCLLPWIFETKLTTIHHGNNDNNVENDHSIHKQLNRKNPSYNAAAFLALNEELMKNDVNDDRPPNEEEQEQDEDGEEEEDDDQQEEKDNEKKKNGSSSSNTSNGRQPLILPPNNDNNNNNNNKNDNDRPLILHFLVSSGCSEYMEWEVLSQIHSARKVEQFGRYTWILSGCLPEDHPETYIKEQEGHKDLNTLKPSQIRKVVQHHFPNNLSSNLITPNLHFTPDFSDMSVYGGPYADGTIKRTYTGRNGKTQRSNFGNHYHFNNKPNGILHWATEYYGNHPNRLDENEVIVVIDPDFLFLKQFHFMDATNQDEKPSPGKPFAAKYGLGGQWLDFNRTKICGIESHCTKVVNSDINKHYSVGPPYIIHSKDVLKFVKQWTEFVPPTYDQYPLLYAEMYAYSMAAAHLNLPHKSIHNIYMGCMIQWPKGPNTDPAPSAKVYRETYSADLIHPNTDDGPASCFLPELSIPPFIHYCQRFAIDTSTIKVDDNNPITNTSYTSSSKYVFFAKRRVAQNVLECDQPHLKLFESKPNDKEKIDDPDWMALTACAVIRAINYARKQHCSIK